MPRPPSRREQAEIAERALRQPRGAPATDNGNTNTAPAGPTVGPVAGGGDPNGLEIIEPDPWPARLRRGIVPSPWAGLPDGWQPLFNGAGSGLEDLTDTAWTCCDLNASIISTMPPYLLGTAATPSTPTDWITNPQPLLYASWEEFLKQYVWDFQLGEVFVVADAFYSNGYPARFHVVEPWCVNVEMDGGSRSYSIGGRELEPAEILHVRYKSTTSSARGIGPLEVGRARMVAAALLHRYAVNFTRGAVPQWLEVEDELNAAETSALQTQWLEARAAGWGFPAVLSGGIKWGTSTGNPRDLALVDLSGYTDARIAVMLGVPPFLAGLPSGGDSMTYSNVVSLFDYHWRASLRPKVTPLMSALSAWLLPRGSRLEVNRDSYVQPGPAERATWYQTMIELGVLTAEQVAAIERLDAAPAQLMEGVMR